MSTHWMKANGDVKSNKSNGLIGLSKPLCPLTTCPPAGAVAVIYLVTPLSGNEIDGGKLPFVLIDDTLAADRGLLNG